MSAQVSKCRQATQRSRDGATETVAVQSSAQPGKWSTRQHARAMQCWCIKGAHNACNIVKLPNEAGMLPLSCWLLFRALRKPESGTTVNAQVQSHKYAIANHRAIGGGRTRLEAPSSCQAKQGWRH